MKWKTYPLPTPTSLPDTIVISKKFSTKRFYIKFRVIWKFIVFMLQFKPQWLLHDFKFQLTSLTLINKLVVRSFCSAFFAYWQDLHILYSTISIIGELNSKLQRSALALCIRMKRFKRVSEMWIPTFEWTLFTQMPRYKISSDHFFNPLPNSYANTFSVLLPLNFFSSLLN